MKHSASGGYQRKKYAWLRAQQRTDDWRAVATVSIRYQCLRRKAVHGQNSYEPAPPEQLNRVHKVTHDIPSRSGARRSMLILSSLADRREFIKISQAVGMGFLIMGAIGYFIKLSECPLPYCVCGFRVSRNCESEMEYDPWEEEHYADRKCAVLSSEKHRK